MPVVYSYKGHIKGENPTNGSLSIPTMIRGSIVPIINAKIIYNGGIISPFTNQFIGAGAYLTNYFELEVYPKLS